MGGSGSSARPLATLFGAEQEGRRGPTLGSAILRDPEASEGSGWRLMLVGPLRVQLFDAYTAQPIPLEDASVMSAMNAHIPFTASCMNEEAASSTAVPRRNSITATQLAIGCQDGIVLVFSLTNGVLSGPLYELKVDGDQPQLSADLESHDESPPSGSSCLAMSVTALRISGTGLYAGACGRCRLWDLRSGELRREFHLPGGGERLVTPGALCVVNGVQSDAGAGEGTQLWIGLDNGSIAVFDVQSGVLVRSFSCAGTEAVVSLALFSSNSFVFALSAHRRVSVWDATTYGFLQKYPAELITCGADLSAMVAADVSNPNNAETPEMSLLLLAGVDGSLCVRKVGRRQDGKLHCVLLCYLENVSGTPGCPITSINYHASTDSVLLGDAGYTVSLLSPLQEQLGNTTTTEIPRLKPGSSFTPSQSPTSSSDARQSASSRTPATEEVRDIEVGDTKSNIVETSNAPAAVEAAESSSPFPVFSGS